MVDMMEADSFNEVYKGYHINWYYDENPSNPRTDWDEATHMICWHNRYDLGDKHSFENVKDFLASMVLEHCSWEEIKDFLTGSCGDCFLEETLYTSEDREKWDDLEGDGSYKFYTDDEHYYTLNSNTLSDAVDEVINDYLTYLSRDDCEEMLEPHVEMYKMSIYDHSGITIWLGAPSDRWDSGYVGYCYMTKQEVFKEYSDATEENWREKAEKLMDAETECYDKYLRGEVYGFQIIDPDGEEVDSCWGYYGDDSVNDEMKECYAIIDRDIAEQEDRDIERMVAECLETEFV